MKIETVYASSVAKLDSDVINGGGTDDTSALQTVLDRAKNGDIGIHLIMDGAALVSHLILYSNTTIECLNKSCGFFQKEQTNNSIVTSDNTDSYHLNSKNISLIGGTYNQDGLRQEHESPADTVFAESSRKGNYVGRKVHYTFGMEFYGVENLLIRDITIRNFRTYALALGGFYHVTIDNCWLELPDHIQGSNQDGFHFWGPGRFLTVKNCGGRVGDDFINVGPDERDRVSSISDVLIDGIFLDDADQAIRLLSRDKGKLDRITIRNISGTYRSFGFYIDPWFQDETVGNFGNIFIENVDLSAIKPNYDYRPACLFSIGGNIESLIIKNVRHHNSFDNRQLFEFGVAFYGLPDDDGFQNAFGTKQKIQYLALEDFTSIENSGEPTDTHYIGIYSEIDTLALCNITVIKFQEESNGTFLEFGKHGKVKNLIKENWHLKGIKTEISDTAHSILPDSELDE